MYKKEKGTTICFFMFVVVICFFVYYFLGLRENLLVHKNFNLPSYHVVVAKYKEDTSWFSHMDPERLRVYDKSGDEHSPFVPLINKGREGATFLGHIIAYYEILPEYVVFLQGNPFPHMRPEIKPENLQENLDRLVAKRPTKSQPLFCDYHEELAHTFGGLMIDRYHKLLFESKPKDIIRFAPGNQYIVPRKDILRRPKVFYQKLWKMAVKGDHYDIDTAHHGQKKFDQTEILGWSLERVFPVILSNVPIKKGFLTPNDLETQTV